MAVTVTDDHTQLISGDDQTGIIADETVVGNVGSNDTNFKVQGTGAAVGQFKAAGVGGMGRDLGGTPEDFSDRHVYCWVNNLDVIETDANSGLRIRVFTTGTDILNNFGEWKTGGRDNRRIFIERFVLTCIDCRRPFDFITGTEPDIASIDGVAQIVNASTGSGQNTWFLDEIKHGSKITIVGGTAADPGVSSEVATDDESDGRGCFKDAGGTFYIVTGIEIGNTADVESIFRDEAEVWVFEDQNVKNDFMTLTFLGNSGAATQNQRFGTSSGTGTAKEGSGGNIFVSAGVTPFQIVAIDANADVEMFGCIFIGPSALRDDPLRNFKQEDNSGALFIDDTTDANDSTANDVAPFPAGAGDNDAGYFGSDRIFPLLKVNTGTAGVGAYTVTWEYSTSAGWAALTDLSDGTGAFKTTGLQTVSYAIPDDWAKRTVDGDSRFWIRARRDAGTVTTDPLITQCFVSQGSNVRLEASSVEAIRCTFSQMETIRVRNGAFLKKSVITDSVAPAKHAALDLGSADPAADTVRDLTIQNCSKGILLKGSGNTTYNFRNIKFSGNTNDVRVDFGAGDTVTINILEGGDTPTIDNVNGSTVTINNAVNLNVTVRDTAGVAVQNARVGIFRDDDNTQLMNELTDIAGLATESFNFVSNTAVSVRVRKGSGGGTDYTPVNSPQTITSSGLDLTITVIEDTNNAN